MGGWVGVSRLESCAGLCPPLFHTGGMSEGKRRRRDQGTLSPLPVALLCLLFACVGVSVWLWNRLWDSLRPLALSLSTDGCMAPPQRGTHKSACEEEANDPTLYAHMPQGLPAVL